MGNLASIASASSANKAFKTVHNRLAAADTEGAALTASKVVVSDANGRITTATPSTAQINFLADVTSLIQAQLNARVDTTGDEGIAGVKTFSSAPIISTLTASKILLSSATKEISSSSLAITDLPTLAGINTFADVQTLTKNPDIAEQAAPETPAAGHHSIYPKTDGNWYVRDEADVERQILTGSSKIAEMYIYNNGTATTVGAQNQSIGIRHFATGEMDGFTFHAGCSGTGKSYTIAAGVCTIADAAHTVEANDYITVQAFSGIGTEGIYRVTSVSAGVSFTFDTGVPGDTEAGPATCNYYMPDQIEVNAGSAGLYRVSYTLSSAAAAALTAVYQVAKGTLAGTSATLCTKCVAERYYSNTDIGVITGQSISSTMATGDRIFLTFMETDGTDAITHKHGSLILTQA